MVLFSYAPPEFFTLTQKIETATVTGRNSENSPLYVAYRLALFQDECGGSPAIVGERGK
jgi:hypothetical protein